GGPYTATAGKELTLDGSKSSDSDGTIKEYIWDFGDNSKTGSGVKPSHTYTKAGEYTVKLTVKDDKGAASGVAETTVTVQEEVIEGNENNSGGGNGAGGTAGENNQNGSVSNQEGSGESGENTISGQNQETPPTKTVIAEAGEDKTADAGKELTFDASQSKVSPLSDGIKISYSWDWNGDGTYDETVNEPVIKHTYDKAGKYTVTLKVTAFENVTSTDTLTVTINEPNKAPTANAGGPYTAIAGKELTLDGSKSSDSDGTIKEYIWDFGDNSKTGSGVKPSHTYSKAGEYTVKLTVKDDKGAASGMATAKVTVKEAEKTYPANTSPITNKTSVVGYTEVTAEQLVKIFKNRNLSSDVIKRAERIAPLYIKYGKTFNIRADIAWAMMCHETGFLTYKGIVPASANNFCGLGATGEKDNKGNYLYNTFTSEELGVIAHYAHLAWYYYPNHINGYCSVTYDPRHSSTHWRYTGDTTLGFLNGRWAPGSNYTDKIILFANQIYGY
ncbi:MAG: PKD domain-containing protein, partial [Actinomycetota bacterium]|nr:PKD domain-containing protein [Actinomycetota bacterium]